MGVKTGGSKSTRSTGTLSRKRSYKPVDELIRPGKKAKVPDSQLTDKQLISRNKRRARNREAAQRQRDRRLQKSALFEEKIAKLELENKNWEEKYRILEDEFQLKMAQRTKFAGPNKKANHKLEKLDQSEAFLNAYQPAKLVHIEKPKPKPLKLSIPTPTSTPASTTTVCPPSRAATDNLNESFCNLNDFIKVDTPTAKHVEKMALTGQDSFFTLFDL